jgi:hypothetical protein
VRKKSLQRRLAEALETPEESERRRVKRHEKRRDAELKRLGWDSYEEFKRDAEEWGRRLGVRKEE